MSLESNINKLLVGGRKMPMDKALSLKHALDLGDDDALRELMYQGYVAYDPREYLWSVAEGWTSAYYAALAKAKQSQTHRRAASRARSSTLSSLGLRRTRSGTWE